jgi:ribosomal protein L29
MDISLIQSTISGLKLAGDIAKGFLELKSISEVQGKVVELQSAILSAQSSALSANSAQAAMVDEIRTLKEEIARIKAWETQKKRYKLTSQWKAGGIAYALKESMKESEPPHLICTKCYEDGRKSLLNPLADSNGFVAYVCPVCKSQIPTGWRGPPTLEYAPD